MMFMLLCYDDMQHWDAVGPAVQRAAMDEAVKLTHELQGGGCCGRHHLQIGDNVAWTVRHRRRSCRRLCLRRSGHGAGP